MWLSGLIINVQHEHCFPWMPAVAMLMQLTRAWFKETDSGGTVVLGIIQLVLGTSRNGCIIFGPSEGTI